MIKKRKNNSILSQDFISNISLLYDFNEIEYNTALKDNLMETSIDKVKSYQKNN